MKSTTFALGSLLVAAAIAQPHQHNHHARHLKRNDPETTVVVTDFVYEYETVGVTTTIWVTPGFVVPQVTTSTSAISTSTTAQTASSQSPAQFFEPASTSSKQIPTTFATSTSSIIASTSSTSQVYVAPPASTSVYVPPVVESTTSTSVAPVVVPTTTSTPEVAYTPPAVTTSAAPAVTAASTSESNSGSTGGVCSSSSPCSGDLTYYEAGLGACGWTNDGSSENVVALPHGLMGTQSNGNPYCGKTITITLNGKSTTAKVVDKCMGCEGDSIDVSNAAFLELADLSVGRTSVKWHFN